LFAYFIIYGKNAEVPVDVLVANITWCNSSQDFQSSAVCSAYVAAARVPPKLGAICPDGLESGVVEQDLVVQTQGRTGIRDPVEASGI